MATIAQWWMWLGFILFVLAMLTIDIFLIGRSHARKVSLKEASSWTLVWVTLALGFNLLLWGYLNQQYGAAIANEKALAFLTGYLIELSLSIDNMFVFLLIFNYFTVPSHYQRRILIFGVLGAIIMRLIMIVSGVWLVSRFHWILYIFGAFLVFTGIKMLFLSEKDNSLDTNPILKWMRKHLRITHTIEDERFFIVKNNLLYVTPLLVILVLIEMSDVIFALDSVPAIFAITSDPFIIFSSNIFAILGLRALYFLLQHMSERFYLLKYAIALILIMVGLKMLVAYWFQIPISVALGFILLSLSTCIGISLKYPNPNSPGGH